MNRIFLLCITVLVLFSPFVPPIEVQLKYEVELAVSLFAYDTYTYLQLIQFDRNLNQMIGL